MFVSVCCVSGAGKTYTMLGRTGEPGIMALTLSDLFTKMEENKATSRYRVTMAYLEVRWGERKMRVTKREREGETKIVGLTKGRGNNERAIEGEGRVYSYMSFKVFSATAAVRSTMRWFATCWAASRLVSLI